MKWHDDALAFGEAWPNHAAYLRACDESYRRLTLLSAFGGFTPDVPTVVCVMRNEERRLPLFVDHYRKLGVKSIHIIDNKSTDRTADIALSYANVTVWRANDSYARASFGQLWVGALVRRHGLNHWVLNVDADELLVYENMDAIGLGDVQDHLSRHDIERLFTPLIDIYSKDLTIDVSSALDGKTAVFFDGKPGDGPFAYRLEETRFGPALTGGPRRRMVAAIGKITSPWLSKFSLAKWDSTTAYANVHFPYPFDRNPSDTFAALIHLKLFEDLAARASGAIDEGEHADDASEYKSYKKWLDSMASPTLLSDEYSVEYKGPRSLLDAGVIEAAPWSANISTVQPA